MTKPIYNIEGLYSDDPEKWTVWYSDLTLEQATMIMKDGNNLTKGLRIVRITKTVVDEQYYITPEFKPQVAQIHFHGIQPLSIEVTKTHVRLSIFWSNKQRNVSFTQKEFEDEGNRELSILCMKSGIPLFGREIEQVRSKVHSLIQAGNC